MMIRRSLLIMLRTINSFHTDNNNKPIPLLARISSPLLLKQQQQQQQQQQQIETTEAAGNNNKIKNNERCHRIGIIYLHGFPDMSINPITGEYASRIPRKLNDVIINKLSSSTKNSKNDNDDNDNSTVFVCFNFSGIIGSDTNMSFQQKTISKELLDTQAIIKYTIDNLLLPNNDDDDDDDDGTSRTSSIHIVGVSTGAIIASLLRNNKDIFGNIKKVTITCIAGLLDLKEGIQYDFNKEQISDFETYGYCWKEFWIPSECKIPGIITNKDSNEDNDNDETITTKIIHIPEDKSKSTKVMFKLNKEYYDECIKSDDDTSELNIEQAVSTCSSNTISYIPPLLVIHGTNDIHVPIENGRQLYEKAMKPKSFFEIQKATHLLSNSSHMKKAMNRIIDFINEYK